MYQDDNVEETEASLGADLIVSQKPTKDSRIDEALIREWLRDGSRNPAHASEEKSPEPHSEQVPFT